MVGMPEAVIIVGAMLAIAIVWSTKIIVKSRSQSGNSFRPPNPATWMVDGMARPDMGQETEPVAPTGIFVKADTELWPGLRVLVEWEYQWLNAEIVTLESGGDVVVHYLGWDSSWDERVPRRRLQMTKEEG